MLSPGFGVFAWGLVTGVAMAKSGLTLPQSVVMTLASYAGSAQLATLPLIAAHAPFWLMLITATIVNLRFVVYVAGLRSMLQHRPVWQRGALGYLVGDVTFVLYMSRLTRPPEIADRVAYYLGAASMNWAFWQIGSLAGIFSAAWIPAAWGLELAGTLALVALLVPLCAQRPALAGIVTASIVAVLAHALPLKLGMLCGTFAGIATAMLVDARRCGREQATP
jgi:predicted branched-subunit amino acid permease